MKKKFFITILFFVILNSLKAQSAMALFKSTYGGDEHYGFSTGDDLNDAKQKALNALADVVQRKLGSNPSGQQFVYRSTSKKGWCAIGSGKDQYGHYLHYEAALGMDSEEEAKRAVLERLSSSGRYDNTIVYTTYN